VEENAMVFSRRRSKSSLRAEAAEAELATLREKLQAMRVTGAPATQLTDSVAFKSASFIRADAAEAELAKLQAKPKGKFLKVSCKIGWCSHSGDCPSRHSEEIHRLTRRMEAMERELKLTQHFSEIRSEMERKIAKVEKEIQRKFATASKLELVIVMDCTGSMGPWIQEAKAAITSIIDNVKLDHPSANVRVGFVAYRDFCDGDKQLEIQTLTSDVAAVKRYISSLRSFGGGDGPEDIPGGLEAALRMPFQGGAKRIMLVADAPCHGSKFNDGGDCVTYRAQIEQSTDICAQMREMAWRGIDFTFIEICPNNTEKMAAILEEEFTSAENHDGFEREFEKVSLANAGDAARFGSVVRSSASSSISASKERSVLASSKVALGAHGTTRQPTARLPHVLEGEEEEEEPKTPVRSFAAPHVKPLDWSEVCRSPDIAAVRHSLHFRPGENIDWKNLSLKHTQQETKIRLTQSCFAKGAMRSAHAMYDCNMDKYLVAKFYFGKAAKKYSASSNSLQNDVKMQIVAKRLATEFSLSESVEKTVDFIFTCWYEIKDPVKAGLSASMSVFTAEPYIAGEYKKYNNNNGWIRADGLNLSETAQAFSHFTWQKTFGELMVVDLQGVGCIFTDPQIHSKQGDDFGCGNLSDAGVAAFFVTHECNAVCKALALRPLKRTELETKARAAWTVPDSLEGDTESTKEVANKSMTCSCPLCGSITTVLHSAFIEAYRGGREVYCETCVAQIKKHERKKCRVCKKKFIISPFWYSMKGIEPPVYCESCQANTFERTAE
jgi:hypothetical protein